MTALAKEYSLQTSDWRITVPFPHYCSLILCPFFRNFTLSLYRIHIALFLLGPFSELHSVTLRYTFLALHCFHVALFSCFTVLADFLCCNFFVRPFLYVALFLCWTFFRIALIYRFFCHISISLCVALFSCCTIFVLHYFFFKLHFFSCTFFISCCFNVALFCVALFSCCTFFILHYSLVALFSCCFFPVLHYFYVDLFPCCTILCCSFSLLHSFHVALWCVNFFQNRFLQLLLGWGCSMCTTSLRLNVMLHFYNFSFFCYGTN